MDQAASTGWLQRSRSRQESVASRLGGIWRAIRHCVPAAARNVTRS